MFKLDLEKAEEPDQISNIHWMIGKAREFQKNIWFIDNAKECSNYHTFALISYTNKVMFKILQAMLQRYMNCELQDRPAGFRKGRETRDQIANIHWIIGKARDFQKTSISALLTMPKPLTVWITINCGKS